MARNADAKSEFGKGLSYCLGLFLAHAERNVELPKGTSNYDIISRTDMWFNAASDHLYEMEIPETLNQPLKERLENFKSKCLKWGHGYKDLKATQEDREWAIEEAKYLLFLIDGHYNIPAKLAEWS